MRLGNTNCSVAREMLLGRVGIEVSRELTQRRVMSEEERKVDNKRILKGKQYISSVSVKILGSLRGHSFLRCYPFTAKALPIDESNRLALDSKIYKCPEGTYGSERVLSSNDSNGNKNVT